MLQKIQKNRFIWFYLPIITWMIAIFSGSSVTSPTVTTNATVDFAAHKTAHIIEYGILGILLFRALRQEKISIIEAVIYSILIAGFYGFTDEFHQSLTPHRTTRLRDVFIDTIGATAGVLIIWKLLPKAPKKLLIWARKWDLI